MDEYNSHYPGKYTVRLNTGKVGERGRYSDTNNPIKYDFADILSCPIVHKECYLLLNDSTYIKVCMCYVLCAVLYVLYVLKCYMCILIY